MRWSLSRILHRIWDVIGNKLVDTRNFSMLQGKIPLSQRRGVITLLHRKGKDEENIKNWRPVSPLNVDYTIMTESLARRLKKVIGTLIHPNQSGFINSRFIGEGIRFIEDLIEYSDAYKKTGIILQLDFEKAFDSLEWNFMHDTLVTFGFGDTFIAWVKLCYNDIQSTVSDSGYTSTWFELQKNYKVVRYYSSYR